MYIGRVRHWEVLSTIYTVIDQANIKANLNHGVLRVTLPKVGPAIPRKVQITEG
ncbi:MAG: hypothetical protein NPIRA01_25600 [Nitrospirales bacterium]|nr:MAG: hypothetical protein NPIRA01_25600 [Nitrospirales bacterium]